MNYVLDTNVISDLLKRHLQVTQRVEASLKRGDFLYLCQPVYYEVLRGLLWKKAASQLTVLETSFRPTFEWLPLTDSDWIQAAHYWETTVRSGRQLADSDLLIAAVASRIDAIVVTADDDFDALPVRRENWRKA